MKWIKCEYKKGEIDRAGKNLISLPKTNPSREAIFPIINNWRSCHAYPLQVFKMNLLLRAKKIDSEALISQRLKRLPSIMVKLQDNPNMKLSQMQDIGGCRTVLSNIHQVLELVKKYERIESKRERSKKAHSVSILYKKYDYIIAPKEDGYRSIHLVYKYQNVIAKTKRFTGQRIEIQIRSKWQHIWATAVETAQIFTGQALKSKVKTAKQSWLRFFALMGSAMADWENQTIVPGTPSNKQERILELQGIERHEGILKCLTTWNAAIKQLEKPSLRGAQTFLLKLDPTIGKLEVTAYSKDRLILAQYQYGEIEKQYENDSRIQVVLISVDSIDALRRAYPNYYADTSEFVKAVKIEIGK